MSFQFSILGLSFIITRIHSHCALSAETKSADANDFILGQILI